MVLIMSKYLDGMDEILIDKLKNEASKNLPELAKMFESAETLDDVDAAINEYAQNIENSIQEIYNRAAENDIQKQDDLRRGVISDNEYTAWEMDMSTTVEDAYRDHTELVDSFGEFLQKHPGVITEDSDTFKEMFPEYETLGVGGEQTSADEVRLQQLSLTPDRYINIYSGIKHLETAKELVENVQSNFETSQGYDPEDVDAYSDDLAEAEFEAEACIRDFAQDWYVVDSYNKYLEGKGVESFDREKIVSDIASKSFGELYDVLDNNFLRKAPLAVQLQCFDERFKHGYAINTAYVDASIVKCANDFVKEQNFVANDFDMQVCRTQFAEDGKALGDFITKYPGCASVGSLAIFNNTMKEHGFTKDRIDEGPDFDGSGPSYGISSNPYN